MDLKLKSDLDAMKKELQQQHAAQDPHPNGSSAAAVQDHPAGGMNAQIPTMGVGAWRKGPAILGAIILVVMGVVGSLAFASQGARPSAIDSFAACEAAGNPILMTYPRQCQLPDGRVFHE